MMPRGSADVRGEQLAAIETEQHALLTSPKVSRLLSALWPAAWRWMTPHDMSAAATSMDSFFMEAPGRMASSA